MLSCVPGSLRCARAQLFFISLNARSTRRHCRLALILRGFFSTVNCPICHLFLNFLIILGSLTAGRQTDSRILPNQMIDRLRHIRTPPKLQACIFASTAEGPFFQAAARSAKDTIP